MHCIMKNFKINVCIYSLTDLNAGHCVELTYMEESWGDVADSDP